MIFDQQPVKFYFTDLDAAYAETLNQNTMATVPATTTTDYPDFTNQY